MYKVGDLFVLKEGGQALKVKSVTNDGTKIRTFRAVKGMMWIPVTMIRPATAEEKVVFKKRMKELSNVRSI